MQASRYFTSDIIKVISKIPYLKTKYFTPYGEGHKQTKKKIETVEAKLNKKTPKGVVDLRESQS